MNFRTRMDYLWELLNQKFDSGIISVLVLFLVFLNVVMYKLDMDALLRIFIILYGAGFLADILFNVIHSKTLDKGYDHLIKVFKPKINLEFKLNLSTIFIFLLFLPIAIFSLIFGEFIIVKGCLFIILFIVFHNKLDQLHLISSSFQKPSFASHFAGLVFTDSKFILYSGSGQILKFDRGTLQYHFLDMDELVLVDTAANEPEKLVVNVSHLPIYEKQELRSLLGEETENLNRD